MQYSIAEGGPREAAKRSSDAAAAPAVRSRVASDRTDVTGRGAADAAQFDREGTVASLVADEQ